MIELCCFYDNEVLVDYTVSIVHSHDIHEFNHLARFAPIFAHFDTFVWISGKLSWTKRYLEIVETYFNVKSKGICKP